MTGDTLGDRVAESLVASFDRFGSPDRLRVLRALQRGEQPVSRLRQMTGLRAEALDDVLADLEAGGFVVERTETLEPLETEYRCSQEVTGSTTTVEQPVETSYAVTEKGAALEPAFEALEGWADEWRGELPDETGNGDG